MVTAPFNPSRLHTLRTDDVRALVVRFVPTRFCVSPEPRDASAPNRRVFVVDVAMLCCCCLAVSSADLVCSIVAFVFCSVVAPSQNVT